MLYLKTGVCLVNSNRCCLHVHTCVLIFQDAVKIMAKDLVRTRRYVKKFILMRANIQAVSLKIQVRVHFLIILWWKR